MTDYKVHPPKDRYPLENVPDDLAALRSWIETLERQVQELAAEVDEVKSRG